MTIAPAAPRSPRRWMPALAIPALVLGLLPVPIVALSLAGIADPGYTIVTRAQVLIAPMIVVSVALGILSIALSRVWRWRIVGILALVLPVLEGLVVVVVLVLALAQSAGNG
jgi:hypothetical protein